MPGSKNTGRGQQGPAGRQVEMTHVKDGESIGRLVEAGLPCWGYVLFMQSQALGGAVADREAEAKGDQLPRVSQARNRGVSVWAKERKRWVLTQATSMK